MNGSTKKTFIRNTEQAKSKTLVINQEELSQTFKGAERKEKVQSCTKEPQTANVKFDIPQLNSALIIAQKIEAVENTRSRKLKSTSPLLQKDMLAIDEKVGH